MSQKVGFDDTSDFPAWRPGIPLNAIPLLPPRIDLETKPVLKRCVAARAAVAELKQAVGHYQFEAIHPFVDGNGRTGRVLNSLFLVEQELLPLPILYLSRFIIARKADYSTLLRGVTRDDAWEPWILFMLEGVQETALWTTSKINAIHRLMAATVEYVRHAVPKIASRELIDVIFEQPYSRIGNLVERELAGRQAASRHLKALTAIGPVPGIFGLPAEKRARMSPPWKGRLPIPGPVLESFHRRATSSGGL